MSAADVMKDAGLLVWRASETLRLALEGDATARRLAAIDLAGLQECAETLLESARRIRLGGAA